MSNEREEKNIDPNTKGIIVFASGKGQHQHYGDWILLIDHVEDVESLGCKYLIFTHVCKRVDISSRPAVYNANWGYVHGMGFKFYKPTPEEIQIVKDMLKEHNKKFVKGINKLIDRFYNE